MLLLRAGCSNYRAWDRELDSLRGQSVCLSRRSVICDERNEQSRCRYARGVSALLACGLTNSS